MNFQLTDEQLQIQKTVKEFAETKILPTAIERDAKGEVLADGSWNNDNVPIMQEMANMGLIGLPYPKEYGATGGDYLSYIIAVEEVSKVDGGIGISYSVSTSLYMGSVDNGGTEQNKKDWIAPVAKSAFGAFGLTEPTAGSDVAGAITTAKKDGDKYILNGLKCFITNGPIATDLIVYALTAPELGPNKGMSAFHITPGTPGFTIGNIHNKMGLKAALVGELVFENCAVDASQLLGEEGKGFATSMKTLNGGRIGVGAQGLGIAEGAYEVARKYLMERQQFGKPLCKQQYLAFKMAELKIDIDAAKFMVYRAALDKQEHRDYSISASMAKYIGTNTAMKVTTEAVQMLGGNGYMKEYHVERMMRDAKITQIYEGTNEIQKLIVSGSLFR